MPKTSTWIDPRIIDDMLERSRMGASGHRIVRYHLRLYAEYLEARGIPFEAAGADEVQLFYEEACSTLASSTARQALNSVKRLHRWVGEDEVQKVGRTVSLPSRTAGEGTRKALTPDEARLVMEACESSRDAALISLLLEGALKTGEIHAANVGDVTFLEDCAVMLVAASPSRPESLLRLPMPSASKLRKYLSERRVESSDEPLFTSESTRSRGARLSDRSIREVVQAIFTRARVPGTAGDYDMRKTALLLARDAGADDEDLVRFARLRSMSTVRDADNQYRYAAESPQERLSRALLGYEPREMSCVARASEISRKLEGFDDDELIVISIDDKSSLDIKALVRH